MGLLLMARRRDCALGAAVVVAAALAGAAAGAAAPAYAAPGLTVAVSPTSVDMKGGDSRAVTVKLTNAGPPERATVTATAPSGLAGDVTVAGSDSACSGSGSTVSCTVDLPPDGQKAVVVTLTAKNPDSLGTGQARTDTTGSVSVSAGLRTTSASYAVTLHGPAPAQSPTPTAAGAGGGSGTSGTGTGSGSGQPGADGAGATASAGTADPSATDEGAAVGYGTQSPGNRPVADTSDVSGLLVGAGVVLVLLGGATIAVLVVRHRRARLAEAREPEPWREPEPLREPAQLREPEPWREPDQPEPQPWPAADAVLRSPIAPVDPWGTYRC